MTSIPRARAAATSATDDGPGVDGDDQRDAVRRRGLDRRQRQAVALLEPAGHVRASRRCRGGGACTRSARPVSPSASKSPNTMTRSPAARARPRSARRRTIGVGQAAAGRAARRSAARGTRRARSGVVTPRRARTADGERPEAVRAGGLTERRREADRVREAASDGAAAATGGRGARRSSGRACHAPLTRDSTGVHRADRPATRLGDAGPVTHVVRRSGGAGGASAWRGPSAGPPSPATRRAAGRR